MSPSRPRGGSWDLGLTEITPRATNGAEFEFELDRLRPARISTSLVRPRKRPAMPILVPRLSGGELSVPDILVLSPGAYSAMTNRHRPYQPGG